MNFRTPSFIIITLSIVLSMLGCQAEETPPPVDIAGTLAIQLASTMLAQTEAAYSPTPPPSPTPLPVTDTPIPTDTPAEPAKDPSLHIVTVIGLAENPACRTGPDESYERISYINTPKDVELIGIGSVPGWYVIKNPYYYSPCWLPADILEIDPAMDLSQFPVMNPGK